MKPKHWLSAVAGAVALGAFSMGAQAAPLGSAATGANAGTGAESLVQEVTRRCWRHRGHWHCRGGYGYGRYYRDSYGYRPGFHFHFGGHRHGHRHWRHRHW
jgi:hypothetical protein